MSRKRNILIYLIFAMSQESMIVPAEWVEIPQFSDDAKVYRMPFNKYVHGEKYFVGYQGGASMHGFENTSSMNEGFRRIPQKIATDESLKPSLNDGNSAFITVTEKTLYELETTKESVTKPSKNVNDNPQEIIHEDDLATVETAEDEEDVARPTNFFDDKIVVDNDPPYQSPGTDRPEEDDVTDSENDSNTSFLAFMPIELFKKVHATLKSQPSSIKGKLSFLKRFEMTLLAEIERRLVPVINPPRRKRESRGDHGWDDHDDTVGFPSLEGALMAISFLTFAVYLIQLVMLLFRNLGNPAISANPVPTATVLFNRNRRSPEEFTERTARILGYIDKFAKSQSTNN